jgi:S-DNA-T family DNA segregation ATPase FtsK/SpoIIIE
MTADPQSTETALLSVAILGVVLTLWTTFRLVRWYRDSPEMRESRKQARTIRRGWGQLALMAGLSAEQPPGFLASLVSTSERKPEPSTRVPVIRVRPDRYGVIVTARTLPGVGLSDWQDAEETLRDAWDFPRVKITQTKPGEVTVRGFRVEPLAAVLPSSLLDESGRPTVRPGDLTSADPILLGLSEDGEKVSINRATSAHGLIAGKTRTGKSITTNTLLAHASLMRDVRLIVIDPNLGAVAPWWRTAHTVCSSVQPEEPTRILREVREEMERRETLFWAGRTDRITEFSEEVPLILVVIDEVANYTRHADRKKREAFEAELTAIASQGAKFGVRLWLLTQKPSADVLSTAVRTNLSARICHRVDTIEDFVHLFPDGRELDVTASDRTMPQGVSVTAVGDMRTPVRMRSVYLSTEACWPISDAVCASGRKLRELPPDVVDLTKADVETAA